MSRVRKQALTCANSCKLVLAAVLIFAGPASAIEISTGNMLGKTYDARSFYVRSNNGQWTKTYTGPQFRKEAAGRLMNLRIAQGLYDDEWLTEVPFDPEKNTDRLISALDTYKQNGVLAISVSLQAGNAGYNKEVPAIRRESEAKFGQARGTLTSAFRPDGTLKEAWLKRLLRLDKELDRRGMILDLMYFYQAKDEVLENPEAIDRGVRNATDWLIDHDCRNVIIEIANEFNVPRYDHQQYIFHQMGHLIDTARARFEAKKASFRLPISASASRLQLFDGVRGHADLTIIHGNHRSIEDKRKLIGGDDGRPNGARPDSHERGR